jgi:tRNA modification GTPase
MIRQDDTIAAIATPMGEGAIAVIRLSGKNAIGVADRVFRGKRLLTSSKSHTAHYGYLVDPDENRIDEVVSTVYRSPHSYTGEDCVEISCHGGMLVTRKILETILKAGARLAEPGEFTKRAFLMGRIDLSQAEAVADLIRSRSDLAHRNSVEQLEGSLSKKVNEIRDRLTDICSLVELELDFAEEGVELRKSEDVSELVRGILEEIRKLIYSFDVGKLYREGVKVAICGKPNVGKSSLLNALLSENRAIVTEIPGTTRDTLEENLLINGILFRVVDTAGIRATADVVEVEGVRRSEAQIASSDIVLLVLDLARGADSGDIEVFDLLRSNLSDVDQRCIFVLNKADIAADGYGGITKTLRLSETARTVKISALTGEGIDTLRSALSEYVAQEKVGTSDCGVIITNVRHKEALVLAEQHLSSVLNSIKAGRTGEFVSLDLRLALDYLGEIVGTISTEDILNNIFAKFCIGK